MYIIIISILSPLCGGTFQTCRISTLNKCAFFEKIIPGFPLHAMMNIYSHYMHVQKSEIQPELKKILINWNEPCANNNN